MSFTYCKSCGHKNIYSLTAPNFCSGCGVSLGSTSKVMPTKKVRRQKNQQDPVDFEDGEDINSVPEISNFKFSVSNDGSYKNKIKLGEIIPNIDQVAKDQLGKDEEG
jgi:hypothetical protein